MKILLSAIACHPEHGSEGGVGWKAATGLAGEHEVHVLTSSANRAAIESALAGGNHPGLTFTYFGLDKPYHENRLLARGQSWLRYIAWMNDLLPQARRVMETRSFDLIHHVTFSTCRVASPLWQLGLPLVFGPSGGGEHTPKVTLSSMSPGQRLYEHFRNLANLVLPLNPRIRQTAKSAAVVLASNQPTASLFLGLGAKPERIFHLPVVFFAESELDALARRTKPPESDGGPLRLFASGILEGRKGLAIALEAVAMATARGVPIEFVIPSRGPEFGHLTKLAHKLGLDRIVKFPESLTRDEFWRTLMSSDIYMMPSLRDNCPATLLEAMLCRCVPFVVDCNGPGEMVPDDAGFKISPANPSAMARAFAGALEHFHNNRAEMRCVALRAAAHVRATFTLQRYLEVTNAAYQLAVSRVGAGSAQS